MNKPIDVFLLSEEPIGDIQKRIYLFEINYITQTENEKLLFSSDGLFSYKYNENNDTLVLISELSSLN